MAKINAAKNVVRFKSWSASRLDDYDQCPYKAKLKHLDKLCPLCFKGAIKGGYDTTAVCSSCGGTPKKGDALERGGAIGDRLDAYLLGEEKAPGDTIIHPKVKAIVKNAKTALKQGRGFNQVSLRFTNAWAPIPGDGFDPKAWLYAKLDFLVLSKDTGVADVIDWKTGGVDKRTGEVRVAVKYDLQLLLYQVATLITQPNIHTVTSALVFLDCKPPHDPTLTRDTLVRAGLPAAIKRLTAKALPLLSDADFAPKASYACGWCDYAKKKGGPCKFGA